MELKDYFLFFGPLAGVITGGIITSAAKWLELRHLRKIELKNARLARLEAIHLMLVGNMNSTKNFSAGIMGLCASDVGNQERRAGLPPLVYEFQKPIEAIASQIVLHVDRLSPEATEAVRLTTEASNHGLAFVDLHLATTVTASDRLLAFNMLKKTLLDLSNVVLNMQLAVAEEVRSLLRA